MRIDSQQMMQLRVLACRNPLLCWDAMATIPWPEQKEYTSIKNYLSSFSLVVSVKNHCKQVTNQSRCIPLHVITECLSHSELHGFG